MQSIFQHLDFLNGAQFWLPSVGVAESRSLHSGTVFLQVTPGVFTQELLTATSTHLFCRSPSDFEESTEETKCLSLSWKRLEAFVDVYHNKEHFGFKLVGHSESVEFFVPDEDTLSEWLDHLAPHCINADLKEDYEIKEELGRGRHATVFRCQHRLTKHEWAVKRIPKQKTGLAAVQEVQNLRRLRHPNIVQLERVYEDEHCVYLVIELAKGGNLQEYLQAQGKLRSDCVKSLALSLAEIFSYLDQEAVFYPSLCVSNLLLCSKECEPQLKLCDFGEVNPIQRERSLGRYSAFIGELMHFMFTGASLQKEKAQTPFVVTCIIEQLTAENRFFRLPPAKLLQHPWLNPHRGVSRSFTDVVQEFKLRETDLRLDEAEERTDVSLPRSPLKTPGSQFL